MLRERAERMSSAAYLELLLNLTWREVKARYSQSFFGVAWAIAQPLATMAVFTIVFSRLAKMPSRVDARHLPCGSNRLKRSRPGRRLPGHRIYGCELRR